MSKEVYKCWNIFIPDKNVSVTFFLNVRYVHYFLFSYHLFWLNLVDLDACLSGGSDTHGLCDKLSLRFLFFSCLSLWTVKTGFGDLERAKYSLSTKSEVCLVPLIRSGN